VIVRSSLALGFTSLLMIVADVIERLVITPFVLLIPPSRTWVLTTWIKIMAWITTRPFSFLGGSAIPRPDSIVPTRPGVLVLMNHQSLFDIPLVIQTVANGYPRIVSRAYYAQRYIPVISHMLKLYQFPLVDPTARRSELGKSLDDLEMLVRNSDIPIAVFPEGTRTKDGEIGRFKTGALNRILAVRPWTVYVYVVDGFWAAAKYKDVLRELPNVSGKMEHAGTLEWSNPETDPRTFVEEVREMMVARLRVMRDEKTVA